MTVVALRPYTLGGSKIPAVLGLDPYLSPYALAVSMLYPQETPESAAMRHGTLLQAAHMELIAEDGYTVMPAPEAGFVHPDLPWLHGHPDGFVLLGGGGGSVHKARQEPAAESRSAAKVQAVPSPATAYRAPLELQLRGVSPGDALRTRDLVQAFVYVHLLDAPAGLVSWLHGGFGGIVREQEAIYRDDPLWEAMVERSEHFIDLLMRGKCPAPSGSDSDRDAIRRRFAGVTEGKRVRLVGEPWEHLLRARELRETIAVMTAQLKRHEQAVQDFMGDAEEAISPTDLLACRWREVKTTRLDVTALRKDHPALAAEYGKTTTTRRFEVNP